MENVDGDAEMGVSTPATSLAQSIPNHVHGGQGDVPTIIAVAAPVNSLSSDVPSIKVKGRDFRKLQNTPIAVAQPFDLEEHYGTLAVEGSGDDDMDMGVDMEDGRGMDSNGDVLVDSRQHRHGHGHRHGSRGLVSGTRGMRNVVPGDGLEGGNAGSEQSDRQYNLLEVFRIARALRHFCIANCIFLLINGLILPVYLVLLALPLCGYFGSKAYNYKLLLVYLAYAVLETVGGVVSIFIFKSFGYTVVRMLYLCFNITCVRYAQVLCQYVAALEEEDFDYLLGNPTLMEVERASWC